MTQTQAEIDRRRYQRDKKKRLAAQKRQDAKEKREPDHKAKQYARDTAPHAGAGAKCAVCGSTVNLEWHHTSYEPPKGEWRCPKHNPRGGAV